MLAFLRKYWDIIGGILAGLGIAVMARFELLAVQVCYSVIILIIVCIGFLRLIRQSAQKEQDDRKHTAIDAVVDGQKPIKAIRLAQAPVEEGEKLGEKIISLWGGLKPMMDKLKSFFSKFKGYVIAGALGVLTAVEMCGGPINAAFGGVLVVKGVAVLPLVTLVCALTVGVLSNGYSKEQLAEIKALLSKAKAADQDGKAGTNKLVRDEIKKQITEKTKQRALLNKDLATYQHERANLESELKALNNALTAKQEMFSMVPQLATADDVQQAANNVAECEAKLAAKSVEISNAEEAVAALTTAINALRSQQ